MSRSKIGYCISVIHHELWGKILIDKKLRSKNWWETRLHELLNTPPVSVVCESGIYNEDGTEQILPTRLESN